MLPMCPVWTIYLWWPERESNPRHEDFQWRVANFLITFQLLTFAKFECATECAINSHANHSVGSPVAE